MFPSLETKLKRYEELQQQLQDPDIVSDPNKFIPLQREMGGLAKVAKAVRGFHTLEGDIAAAREMIAEETDADAKAYAAELQRREDGA